METLRLTRIGENSNGEIVYKDESTGKFYIDINHVKGQKIPSSLYACSPSYDIDGEAAWPVKQKFEIVNPFTEQELLEENFRFEYMMLSRVSQDCVAYFGTGDDEEDKWDCRYQNERQIYGKSIKSCIEKMKELWQKIPASIKPQWITWEQILQFEQKLSM